LTLSTVLREQNKELNKQSSKLSKHLEDKESGYNKQVLDDVELIFYKNKIYVPKDHNIRVSSERNFSFQFLVFRMVLFSFEICSCVSSDVLLKFQFSIFSFIFVFCPPIGGYYNDNFNTPPTLSRPIRLLSDYPRQIHSFD
jgi:hypothetical protein